jgi:hypothetical protein
MMASTGWEAEVVRLLDERHLAAWSSDPDEQVVFSGRLGAFLQGLDGAEVVRVFGSAVVDLEGLCHQLECSIPGEARLRRRVSGPLGLASRLRSRAAFPGRASIRSRYIVWHDVDVLLSSDRGLFGEVLDTIAGVAAESEYASDDLLLLTRAVYIGGPRLAGYAADDTGQLRRWLAQGPAEPFWRVVSGLERPPVLGTSIGRLLRDPEALATDLLLDDLGLENALGF